MSGPLMSLALWDPHRDVSELYRAVAEHLVRDGARLDDRTVAVHDHEHFSADGEAGHLNVVSSATTGDRLVELVWSLASAELKDAADDWRRLYAAIGRLLLAEGWVDPTKLNAVRRARFDRLAARGIVHAFGPGRSGGRGLLGVDRHARTTGAMTRRPSRSNDQPGSIA